MVKMPGIICQENATKCSNGAYESRQFFEEYSSRLPDSDTSVDHVARSRFMSASLRSRKALPKLDISPLCVSEGETFKMRTNSADRERGGVLTLPMLIESRRASLSRGDLLAGRRLSLEPSMRCRSHSQPPAVAHSAPADTSLHLAEAALHNAFATCAFPSIKISKEDVSQGESNLEDEKQAFIQSTSQDESLIESSKSPHKSPVKSPSLSSSGAASSHFSPLSGEKETPEIPTDLSDTVDSEPDKEKSIGSIAETIMCPNIATHHVGREIANAVYGLPIDALFTLLFTSSKFMFDLHADRKTYDVVISPWQSNPETNQKIRQVTYTLTLPTNSFGPKVSHVTETQVISAFSKPSEIYTIDAEASNSGIPYADSFFVSNHWCLTRESATETRLTLWSQVKYKKNVWGFMKNVIDKNAFSGMDSLMSDINGSLIQEVDRTILKRTKRRRRRAGSKGNDVADLLHVPSPIISNNDIHKSTQIPSRKMTLPSVTTDLNGHGIGASTVSIILFFFCALLVVNGFLCYRLYSLEERVMNSVPLKNIGFDSSAFKLSGQYNDDSLIEEWVQILRHQESLHAEELERWRKSVIEAADHLRKAEESLRNLHSSIPSKQASKMQALLHRLQLLQQMQEQKKYQPQANSPVSTGDSPSPPKEPPLDTREL